MPFFSWSFEYGGRRTDVFSWAKTEAHINPMAKAGAK
jgi:hypothetical protein